MPIFPLPKKVNSYKVPGCSFGAARGERKHAGCDLIIEEGTEIYAVDDGEVITAPYEFYHGTHAFEVKHADFIVRYCEVWGPAKGGIALHRGQKVTKGEVVAKVGKMEKDSMLHFEMYTDTSSAEPLTVRSNPPFQRRTDLIDPASYLDQWPLKGAEDAGEAAPADGGSADAGSADAGSAPADPSGYDLGTTLGIQQALKQLGYDVGSPDGWPGPRTSEAIRAFQASAGLTADGSMGPNTRDALTKALQG